MSDTQTVLMSIPSLVPDAIIDLRYASTNNITGQKLYRVPKALLRGSALEALQKAADILREQNLRLVVWDAYRPPAVQLLLRNECDDDKYVAPVSNHSRGVTVDVTLADNTGNYLDMGTDFDEFSTRAHTDTEQISDDQKDNRQILSQAMLEAGFRQLPFEWWHFDFVQDKQPEVITEEL